MTKSIFNGGRIISAFKLEPNRGKMTNSFYSCESMAKVVLLNKPYNVLCQFTGTDNESTLSDFITDSNVYPAGRLDKDSEGLVLLTDDGQLQHRIAHPKHKLAKTYWVQVEGEIHQDAIIQLGTGVVLKEGKTLPAKVNKMAPPNIWNRTPAIRQRQNQPTSWLELTIKEGKNRQVRRMTAAVGFPTLRLIRWAIGQWCLGEMQPGDTHTEIVHLPKADKPAKPNKRSSKRKKY